MGLFAIPNSGIGPFAEALGWLWRLPVVRDPGGDRVGIGTIDEAAELHALLRSGDLRAAAIFGSRPGPDRGPVPGRQRFVGVADFGARRAPVPVDPGGPAVTHSARGAFTVLHGQGNCLVSSNFGAHALLSGEVLYLGCDPMASWGTVQDAWMYPALAHFFEQSGLRITRLPAVGLLRYDDVPGTAAQQ